MSIEDIVNGSVEALSRAGVELASGLSTIELASAEDAVGCRFPDDLRALLAVCLPLGDQYPNWRDPTSDAIRSRMDDPASGLIFDVRHNGLWAPSFGPMPDSNDDRVDMAKRALELVPPLIPLFGHRYIPTDPTTAGNPVLSVMQADIIVYGANLAEYWHHEFSRWEPPTEPVRSVTFWSWFVDNY